MIVADTLIVSSIQGDVDTGGWTANCQFVNDQSTAEYGRHVTLWHMTEESGVFPGSYSMALNGSVSPKQITWDRRMSNTEVIVATSHLFLQNAGLQGMFFAEAAAPANPHEMTGLCLGSIAKHIVEEHCNISQAAGGWVNTDYMDVVDSTTVNVYTVRESDSIWRSLQAIAENEFYVVYFTKDDILVYDSHPMFAPALPDVTVTFDATMIVGAPIVTYNDLAVPDQVRLYALTDQGETLQSFYPEDCPLEGRKHKVANVRCNTQARLDQLAFRLLNFKQRRFQAKITLAGAWGLRLELYDRVGLTYTGTATNGVAFAWIDKKFWISNITVNRVSSYGVLSELTLEEEFFGEGYFYA